MEAKPVQMFYFDDRTFITLCRQLERELKDLHDWSADQAFDLRLAYEKFELFLSVYLQSKGREEIDYKTGVRAEIASDVNFAIESQATSGITEEFQREKFHDAKEKLHKVIEDVIYQIRLVTI
ncbi:MAG TPA: hypothetical protein VGE26_08875 [Sphingobacteriaceae bacterium]